MFIQPNPQSFLSGVDPFFGSTLLEATPDGWTEEIVFDLRHEGFIGIPHGGLAMGIGQALLEKVEFDPVSGQPLSGSFMDYCMPRADDFPHFDMHELPDRCRSNPIGVKGAGESGTVGAPPTVINAIVDALRERGVRDVPMPATPLRVWQAMQDARAT